mmetsp:Transcript_44671/g.142241  ORF Transcript_44671/g.142241 Transcript_44671/m.142241 type:complete len:252 (-) Transcript_44671:347-1102(-)
MDPEVMSPHSKATAHTAGPGSPEPPAQLPMNTISALGTKLLIRAMDMKAPRSEREGGCRIHRSQGTGSCGAGRSHAVPIEAREPHASLPNTRPSAGPLPVSALVPWYTTDTGASWSSGWFWKMSRSVLRMALMKRRTLWSFLRCPVGQCRRRLGVPAAPNDHSAHIPLDSDGSQSTVYPRELPKRVVMVSTCPSPSLLESVYTLRPNIAGEGGTRPRGGDGVAEAPGSSPRLPMPRELKTEPHLKELPNDR